MKIITSKRCYLAFFTFILILISPNTKAITLNTVDVKDEDASTNIKHASGDSEKGDTDNCDEGETAFAFLNEDDDPLTADAESNCFIPKFNRWGWTTFLDFSAETGQSSYELDIYAGAGQCDLTKGSDVGSVTVTYNEDSSVTFNYSLEGYVLSEAHIYINNDEYPTNNNGTETVAPGQYTFTDSDFEEGQNYSATIPVDGTEFYVIIHGVTKGEDCNDGDCDDSDNDGVCDSDDICPGHDDSLDADGDGIPDGCDNVAYSARPFKVYPVPFKDELNVRYSFDYATNIVIEIFDTKGIKLASTENNNYVQGTDGNMKLDLSHLGNQLLFLRLTTAKSQFTKKIISSSTRPNSN